MPSPSSTIPPSPHRKAVIGSSSNFWLHSTHTGFDLTRPASLPTTPSPPSLTLQTTTAPITLAPHKTALLIIDMQNFFLSPALGRSANGPGHAASAALATHAIPAARRAGIRVVWVNWGLTEEEAQDMPAGVKRAFGFWSVTEDEGEGEGEGEGVGVDKHGALHAGAYKGIGADIGPVRLATGEEVSGGGLLMRGSWNARLHPPLLDLFDEGARLPRNPDVWIHKSRMSGLWGASTPLQVFLEEEGLTTLLFAGVNTDQCVGGTMTDAFSKGYDCVLLRDGCGSSSPAFAQECWEWNAANTFGFCSSCGDLERAVEGMGV